MWGKTLTGFFNFLFTIDMLLLTVVEFSKSSKWDTNQNDIGMVISLYKICNILEGRGKFIQFIAIRAATNYY